jgi:hypothetical protein
MRRFADRCVIAVFLAGCGLAEPLRAQSEHQPASNPAGAPASLTAALPFVPVIDFGQVIQPPAGPPPTPRHTGIKAMLKGLVIDFKYLPSRENLLWAGVGGGLAAAVHPVDDDLNRKLVGNSTADKVFKPGEILGEVPEQVTYHTPCHLRAQNIGFKSRDLMKLTGAKVKLVQQCSGIDGMWGLRADNEELSFAVGRKLGLAIAEAGGDVVAGDCHLANGVVVEQTGREAVHPIQVVARAYGIPPEPERSTR